LAGVVIEDAGDTMQERYNEIEVRWEWAGDDWDLQYNAITNEWAYAPPGSHEQYNEMKTDGNLPLMIGNCNTTL
jgi:hypothetical protein